MDPRPRSLPDDHIDAKIFHRGIQNFFHRGLQAMYFVEKENLFALKRSKNRRQIAFAIQQRSRTRFNRDVQFVRDNLRQRRFAQPRRPIQQHMIERFPAAARRFDGDLNILFHPLLSDVFAQPRRPNAGFDARVFVVNRTRHNARSLAPIQHSFCTCVSHSGPSAQGRAARPFGVFKICSAPRSIFSKFTEPTSRFASPTAVSATR